jgi:hypothetical protein
MHVVIILVYIVKFDLFLTLSQLHNYIVLNDSVIMKDGKG